MRQVVFATVTAVMIAASGVSGCGRRGEEFDLVIISPHDEKITEEFERGFARVFTRVHGRAPRMSWRDFGAGTEAQMRAVLDQFSRQPAGIGVDLFFGGGIDPYRTLKAKGLLTPYRVRNIDDIPAELLGVPLYDRDYQWYGAVLSSFGILYNKTLLRKLEVPEPRTWEDMTDARLMGYVGLADPSRSGSARAIYEMILQAYGWEKGMGVITLMAANASDFHAGSSSLVKDVTLGDVAMGPAIDFYGWTQIAEAGEDVLGFVLPEKLTVITPDTIAILKGAPNPETARMFLDFVMGEAGQRLWLLKAGTEGGPEKYNLLRMPVLPSVYERYAAVSARRLNPFKFTSSFTHDSDKGSARRELVADLMKSLLMQPQEELRACWKAVQGARDRERLIAKMTVLPLGESEALEMARTKWEDQEFRARTMTAWVHFALKKYADVRAEAEAAAK